MNTTKYAAIFAFMFLLPVVAVRAQQATIANVYSFTGADGNFPYAGLTLGSDANYCGTTYLGGANNTGNFFSFSTSGTLTSLYSFPSASTKRINSTGDGPFGTLLLSDGKFYGGAQYGGTAGNGTLFSFTTAGTLVRLHSFSTLNSSNENSDGAFPQAGLAAGAKSAIYGVTSSGGANGTGVIFSISSSRVYSVLYTFSAVNNFFENSDGANPFGGLIKGSDGSFYGTTFQGGTYGHGTIYKVTSAGAFTTLHSFQQADGYEPMAALVQSSNHFFFGTTVVGGAYGRGTIFRISTTGVFKVMHSFAALSNNSTNSDGIDPEAPLIQAADGNLYGTAQAGGAYEGGTVFEMTTSGIFADIFDFPDSDDGSDVPDGIAPAAPLVQASNGTLYGTCTRGGSDGQGTIFQLTLPG